MARQTKVIGIEGESYEVTQLGAERGMELYHALVKEVGPLVQEYLSPKKKSGESEPGGEPEDEDVNLTFGRFLLTAIGKISKELLRELRVAFAANCKVHVSGMPMPMTTGDLFDQHFAGRYGLLTKWLLECLKFNFLGFLADSSPGASPR